MLDISTVLIVGIVGIVSVPKRSTLETFRRELSEDLPFAIINRIKGVAENLVGLGFL